MNREVKVIIPNMREFRVFYSDNEGSVMFFKRDWREEKQEEHWKPSEEQMNCLCATVDAAIRKHNESVSGYKPAIVLKSLYEQLKKLM